MKLPDAFYDLQPQSRNKLLAFHAKAANADSATAGFAGDIVFFDNGEGAVPRRTAAKFPKLREDLAPRESARRFLREMKLQAAAYYHPNVHWPFDMKFVLGVPIAFYRRWEGDLADFIEADNFGDLGRLALTIQLAAGLAHCHDRGLVHQDLKPENVFVRDLRADFSELPDSDYWLRPLVADFGSVNLASEIQDFTGSRPYMAPEQWVGSELGPWTSAFVLGVMLHELMSRGVHPIGESSRDWHRQIRPGFNRWQQNKKWRRWCENGCPILQPLDDAKLASIIARCLSQEPNTRPTLPEIIDCLHTELHQRSPLAAAQVSNFLSVAQRDTQAANWPRLVARVEQLERAIDEQYPAPMPTDAHGPGADEAV